jgi:NAD(P)-dependent dehydrogenase (short-subunit alcohol dehydrogenase family)
VLARAAAEMTEATGRTCLGVPADVRKPDEVEAAFDRTLEAFGRVDIVINGAAGNFLAPAATLSYNAFRTVMEIDALGTFNVSKAAFTKYLGAHGGNIVNISATLHYKGTPLQTHPGSAKAAVDAMTRHLAVEWGAAGIRVNAIAPGPIDETEGMKRLAPGDVKQKGRAADSPRALRPHRRDRRRDAVPGERRGDLHHGDGPGGGRRRLDDDVEPRALGVSRAPLRTSTPRGIPWHHPGFARRFPPTRPTTPGGTSCRHAPSTASEP